MKKYLGKYLNLELHPAQKEFFENDSPRVLYSGGLPNRSEWSRKLWRLLMGQTQKSGIIKRLNDKGFGFISVPGERDEFFFHRSGIRDNSSFESLSEGQSVRFTPTRSPKGARAEDIYVED